MLALKKISRTPLQIKELIKEKNINYKGLIRKQVKQIARKGVLEIINYIKNKTKKKLSLATSTTKAIYSFVLDAKGLNIINKFDFIICGEEINNSKPHPEIYLKVKEYFNIPSDRCLIFEDSAYGVQAAKNAETICFAAPSQYTKKQNFSRADFIISDLSKKAKIIS